MCGGGKKLSAQRCQALQSAIAQPKKNGGRGVRVQRAGGLAAFHLSHLPAVTAPPNFSPPATAAAFPSWKSEPSDSLGAFESYNANRCAFTFQKNDKHSLSLK